MQNYWFIKGDFLKERSRRIGASDLPAMIPNPEKPTESLSAYGKTPITVWQEKTGRKKRDPAGLPAEMGNFLEEKVVEVFARTFGGAEMAREHANDRRRYEFADPLTTNAAMYQSTPYMHHTQFYRDGMIAHPDAIFHPGISIKYEIAGKKYADGVLVNFDKPFLVEAKSARFWATRRPDNSTVTGYDFTLKTWQGVPLKHYMQIQFQLALLEVDIAYLALISDTSDWNVWRIAANPKHQGRLIDLAGRMVWHIEHDQAPGDMAINAQDIIDLYPVLGDDFVFIDGEEHATALKIAEKAEQATTQEKRWKASKTDAKDAMAVILKDRPEIRDAEGIIAKWKIVKPSEKILALSKIKADNLNAYRYLKRNGLIEETAGSRTVDIKRKKQVGE